MIIQTCRSTKLLRQELQKLDVSLTDLLGMGRAMELAEFQALWLEQTRQSISLETAQDNVLAVNLGEGFAKRKCYSCSGTFPHGAGTLCPARGKIWHSCGKLEHFSKCSCSKDSQEVEQSRQEVHSVHTITVPQEKGHKATRL